MTTLDLDRWLDVGLTAGVRAEAAVADVAAAERAVVTSTVGVPTADRYPLVGTLYQPPGEVVATVALFSGTGIPRRFYDAFARFLTAHGLATLTLDYRGIGDSTAVPVELLEATKIDWGRLDMTAAFEWLNARYRGVAHFIFGHSVGGQLIGLMDGLDDLDGVATYGCGFGYWGNMRRPYRYFVWSMWYLYFPLAVRLTGYLPSKWAGLGEDLPRGVAENWYRWGRRAEYFGPELGDEPGFDVAVPWQAYIATDDPITTPTNSAGMLSLYRNADIETIELDPTECGTEELGHLRFFSRRNRHLWSRPVRFFRTLA